MSRRAAMRHERARVRGPEANIGVRSTEDAS
jgi:hypothetical protein